MNRRLFIFNLNVMEHPAPMSPTNPKTLWVIGQARRNVVMSDGVFDRITEDLSDPKEGIPALLLFTREFYEMLRKHLTSSGCMTLPGKGISPRDLLLHGRMVSSPHHICVLSMTEGRLQGVVDAHL